MALSDWTAVGPYRDVLRIRGASRFAAAGFLSRFPFAMTGIALTLLLRHAYGAYGVAGAVTATYTVAGAICAPIIARLVDRRGQSAVGRPLLAIWAIAMVGLLICAWTEVPAWAVFIPAVAAGACVLPIAALTRSRWSRLAPDPGRLQAAFSLEAVFDDVAFVIGPTVATVLATSVAPQAGLILVIVWLAGSGMTFLAQRDTEPAVRPADHHDNVSAIRIPGVAVISIVFIGVGIVFGANGITMVAVCESLGATWAAGLVMGTGSAASMVGALFYGARLWHSALWKRYLLCLVLLTGGMALFLIAKTLPAMLAVAAISGLAISPSFINGNALIQRIVPAEALTEGLTWIGTACGIGMSLGSMLAGQAVDLHGPRAGFIVLSGGSAVSFIIAAITIRTVKRRSEVEPRRNMEWRQDEPGQPGQPGADDE